MSLINSPAKHGNRRSLSPLDKLIVSFDRTLRSLNPGAKQTTRESPAAEQKAAEPPADNIDTIRERRNTAGLMRINHTGEVCAQALYKGQSLTARDVVTREAMLESAREEEDHLAWCEERLQQLDARPSMLNPAFYAMSFGIGTLAGALGDRLSLGFIAATERQVCEHLREHLAQLPQGDAKSRAILQQMLADEAAHGEKAIAFGGMEFHPLAERVMKVMSKVMTGTTYYI
ncbi:MAG: 2-polyprenyl-3-methyl-6-methoxy-1,4-benzoquinone monooxygenase [Pseudomonadales bacterium]